MVRLVLIILLFLASSIYFARLSEVRVRYLRIFLGSSKAVFLNLCETAAR